MKKNNLIKNKKGIAFLGEHTLNLVIAVICIGFLIYLGVRIYYLFTDKEDLDKANDNLKTFVLEYKGFIQSPNNEKEFIVLGNKDWYMLFFSKEGPNPNILVPIDCKDYKNCVCMCTGNLIDDCNEKYGSVCLDLGSKWIGSNPPFSPIEISQIPYTIKVTK
jgi:hypothetical protein